jgi:uncharacterized protein (TIGR02145 family)
MNPMIRYFLFGRNTKNPNSIFAFIVMFSILLIPGCLFAQAGINTDGSSPDNSAMLDIKSNNLGFLPPRMNTADRNSMTGPAEGLVIYNTDTKTIELYNGSIWTSHTGRFICGISQVKDTEERAYETIPIGDQCWMASNMDAGTMISNSSDQTDNTFLEKYCYGDIEANCEEYGGLYQWGEAMQYEISEGARGICPLGWHIPTAGDWAALESSLGGAASAGGKLKETGTQRWNPPNTGASNETGYGAPGAGYINAGNPIELKYYSGFWTSREEDETYAEYFYLAYNTAELKSGFNLKTTGFSVRCIKD